MPLHKTKELKLASLFARNGFTNLQWGVFPSIELRSQEPEFSKVMTSGF